MINLLEDGMVTDYKMIRAGVQQLTWFEQQVKEAIDIGWQPHGPLQLITVDKHTVLLQPLILTAYHGSVMEK